MNSKANIQNLVSRVADRLALRSDSSALFAEKKARPLVFEALEPRVLFSGAPVAAPAEAPVAEAAPTAQAAPVAAAPVAAAAVEASPSPTGVVAAPVEAEAETVVAAPPEAVAEVEAAPDAADGATAVALTEAELSALTDAAAGIWAGSGISEDQSAALASATYQIGDLADIGGNILGSTEGNLITIDDDGAGRGWFIDDTPQDGSDVATATGIDLLSVLLHEQGHLLGLEGSSGFSDIMNGVFVEGERRLPDEGQAEGATPGSLEGVHFAIVAEDFESGLGEITVTGDFGLATFEDYGSGSSDSFIDTLSIGDSSGDVGSIQVNAGDTFQIDSFDIALTSDAGLDDPNDGGVTDTLTITGKVDGGPDVVFSDTVDTTGGYVTLDTAGLLSDFAGKDLTSLEFALPAAGSNTASFIYIDNFAYDTGAAAPTPAGALITGVTIEDVSTEFTGDGRLAVNLVGASATGAGGDGTGLTAGNHSLVVGDQWLSTGTCCGTSLDPDPSVVFDLGAVYTIDSFSVWNYNEHATNDFGIKRGVQDLTINYGETTGLGTTLTEVDSLEQAPLSANNPGTDYNNGSHGFAPFEARYIEFDINSNYGDTNSFYGLAEVQFFGTLVPTAGALITGVTIEDVSTEFTGDGRLAVNLVGASATGAGGDGTGLTAGNHSLDVGDQWLSTGTCCGTSLDPDPSVVFDLGAVYTIDSFSVWNYNEHESADFGIKRGVQDLTINYGETTGLGTTLTEVTSLDQAPLSANNPGTDYNNGSHGFAPFDARYIEFDINSNYGDTNSFYGLAEVQFFGTLVPTVGGPAQWDVTVGSGNWDDGSSWVGGVVPTFDAGDTAMVWYDNHLAAEDVLGVDEPWNLNPAVHTFGVELNSTVTLGTIVAGHDVPGSPISESGEANHWDNENYLSHFYGTGKVIWDNNGAGALFDQSEMNFRDPFRAEWSIDMELADDLTMDIRAERDRRLSSTITESGGPHELEIWHNGGTDNELYVSGANANTYSGGTTIDGDAYVVLEKDGALGTGDVTILDAAAQLKITNDGAEDRIGDSAGVFLVAGSTLILDSGVDETVGALYFDDVRQEAGTWGRLGLTGVDYNTEFITGDGVLTVPSFVPSFTSSDQLNLTGRDVLAAVNLWEPDRVGDGQSTVGVIQGVDFDDIDSTTQDNGAPIALTSGEAGATLAISPIGGNTGREFPVGGTFTPPSADNTEAEKLPSGQYFQNGDSTTLTFAFGAGRANTEVEVQIVGGGVWNRTDKWGILTAKVGGEDKGILEDRGTPDLLTFSATTDASGNLAIDVVQTPGGSGSDRQWNILGGITVTAAEAVAPSNSAPVIATDTTISVVNTDSFVDATQVLGGRTETISFDAGATADKLVVQVSAESSGGATVVTYNGEVLTLADGTAQGRNKGIYYLDNPYTGGVADLVVDMSAIATVNGVGVGITSLSGTAPGVAATALSPTETVTIDTAGDSFVVVAGFGANNGPTGSANAPLTQIYGGFIGSAEGAAGYESGVDAGSHTYSFSDGAPNEVASAAAFAPASNFEGAVTEDDSTPDLTDTGTLTFTDADLSDEHTVEAELDNATLSTGGAIPTATSDALTTALATVVDDVSTGDGAGTIDWTFTLDNSLTQFLGAGESITAVYDVTVIDDSGDTAEASGVYNLTVDGGGLAGTLTFDSSVAPTSVDGSGNKTFTNPTAALPAFSFTRDGSTAVFDQTDDVFELFLVTDASNTPLFLKIDIDDSGGDFLFVEGNGLDLTAGTGQYQPGGVNVTGAALAPDAPAEAVVYDLTVDGGGLAGTLTFDSSVAPTSVDGSGNKTFTNPTAALPAFSFTRDGSTAVFDQTDDVFELFLVTDASNTPLFLKIDIDDSSGDFLFVEGDGLDLTAGTGQYQPGGVNVTSAALTPTAAPTGTGDNSDTEQVTITIYGVNDAPTLGGSTLNFNDVGVSQLDNDGDSVADLLNGQAADVDNNTDDADVGIAVTATTINGTGTGVFQYQLADGGSTAPTGSAVSVAFNAAFNDGSDRFFMPTDTAGVVPLANWNNADASSGGTYGSFVDESGNASALTISSTTGGNGDSWNTWGGTPDWNINSDWANGLTQMVLADIPYTNYDLIVYAGANFGNDNTDITVGGTTINLNDTTGGNPNRDLVSGRDYVTFSGLSGASQTVDFANVANGIGVGGFQVVEVDVVPPAWTTFSASEASSLLLRPDDRIRFLPDGTDFAGGEITFRAWDRTSGNAGDAVSTATNGGTTPFSSAARMATVAIAELIKDGDEIVYTPTDGETNTLTVSYDSGTSELVFVDTTGNIGGTREARIAVAPGDNLTIQTGDMDDTITIGSLGIFDGNLTVDGGADFDTITFNGSVLMLDTDKNVDLDAERVRLFGSTISTTGDGTIAIDGTGGGSAGAGSGIYEGVKLKGSSLSTENGDITVTGQGGDDATGNEGIQLSAGSTVMATGTGSVTLAGQGGTLGSSNTGVSLIEGSTVSSGVDGGVTVTGTGGGERDSEGVNILHGSTVSGGALGVMITGTADGTGVRNDGVYTTSSTISASDGGSVTITGTASQSATSGANAIGVRISSGTTVDVTDGGSITLTGTGGTGTSGNEGVHIGQNSALSTEDGDITITGTSSATGANNYGVNFLGGSSAASGGALTITGTGGAGNYGNAGVSLLSTTLTSATLLSVTGTGQGTGWYNHGIIGSGSTITGGTGVTLTGTGSQGSTTGYNDGIRLSGTSVTATGGTLAMAGLGGTSGSANNGVNITNGSLTGALAIAGTGGGGAGGNSNAGVKIAYADLTGVTGGTIEGTGGMGSFYNYGAVLYGNLGGTAASATGTAGQGAASDPTTGDFGNFTNFLPALLAVAAAEKRSRKQVLGGLMRRISENSEVETGSAGVQIYREEDGLVGLDPTLASFETLEEAGITIPAAPEGTRAVILFTGDDHGPLAGIVAFVDADGDLVTSETIEAPVGLTAADVLTNLGHNALPQWSSPAPVSRSQPTLSEAFGL